MDVGIAMGSPSHQPSLWQTYGRSDDDGRMTSPIRLEPDIGWRDSAPESGPKLTRWKTLGRLFGKKPKSCQKFQPLPDVKRVAVTKTDNVTDPFQSTLPDTSRGRSQSDLQQKAKNRRPDFQRAATAPTKLRHENNEESPETFLSALNFRPESGRMLDVSIPGVQLERYSVMFGSVLEWKSQASSLLERRQATLDKLETVNEAVAEYERHEPGLQTQFTLPRHARPPQTSYSPSVSLFLHAHTSYSSPDLSIGPQVHLQRSNTISAAVSPARPPLAEVEFDSDDKLREEVRRIILGQERPPASSTEAPDCPLVRFSNPRVPGAFHVDVADNSLVDSLHESHHAGPVEAHHLEIIWKMDPKDGDTEGGKALSTVPAGKTSTESTRPQPRFYHNFPPLAHPPFETYKASLPPLPAISSPKPLSGSEPRIKSPPRPRTAPVIAPPQKGRKSTAPTAVSLQSAVDIHALEEAAAESAALDSIARQISISQRQRQLLVPVKGPPRA
ncbi:MAG: hypothetical protein M1818_007935 [Claussenomyces sp. TS43310]|nr:MAG: hypothetical protein M1818_007935 [Claussenomyces sp. TS43310]